MTKEKRLVATEPKVCKSVFIGTDSNDSDKKIEWIENHDNESFEIIEVGTYSSKLKGVPYKINHRNIYECEEYEITDFTE